MSKSGTCTLVYPNLIAFLLSLSGHHFENTDSLQNEDSDFLDTDSLTNAIYNSILKNEIFSNSKLISIFDIVSNILYNR
jgi:hypothetical protein